jgi:hypothetical protein
LPEKRIAHCALRRMFVCLRGASPGASPGTVTSAATKQAREKTSKAVWTLTEIA